MYPINSKYINCSNSGLSGFLDLSDYQNLTHVNCSYNDLEGITLPKSVIWLKGDGNNF